MIFIFFSAKVLFMQAGNPGEGNIIGVKDNLARPPMSTTGLEVFDKTIQTSNIWLKEIEEVLGPDRQRAYHALMAVLHAVRDRLPTSESAQFAAQLPMLIRGLYFHRWRPHERPNHERSLEEFLSHVEHELQNIRPIDADEACHAVFHVLEHHVSPEELEQVKHMLPKDVRRFWYSMINEWPPEYAGEYAEARH
jgi:uncharacterized protein (DUF2267 family)